MIYVYSLLVSTIPSRTNEVIIPEPEARPIKQIKVLKSLKSIYVNQRSTCNDLFLYTSIKNNLNHQLNSISKKYKKPHSRSQYGCRLSKEFLTAKDSEANDSKNSMEIRMRKTPYLRNMILKKIFTTNRDEDDSKSIPSQCSTSRNPLTLSNSIAKTIIKDPCASERAPPKIKFHVTPIGSNGEKIGIKKFRIKLNPK